MDANNADLRQPLPRGRRREHRLHDPDRVHGAARYREPPRRRPPHAPGHAHPQYYKYYWSTENNRWIWLRPHRFNRTLARCIVCHRSFRARIVSVREHEQSHNHQENMQEINPPMDPIHDPHLDPEAFANEVATIKIILSIYFSDEGIAYRKIDTLLPVIKRIARHPDALQEVKLSRTELSQIISHIIAPGHKQHLAATLENKKFSSLFDESTSISKDKHGCLLLRFADDRSYRIRTILWDLMPVYREDNEHNAETAESLYNMIIDSLFDPERAEEENRDLLQPNNYIASGTDGCNTMIGVHNSVTTRLRVDFPGINNVVRPCHKAHLCASHAIVVFRIIVELLKIIYNWFSSAKRLHALQQQQIRLNLDIQRLLRFVESRWLTGLPALIRLQEQIMAIDATLAVTRNNPQAVQLLNLLREPMIRCIVAFLTFILEVVEDLNAWMQTEEVILPEMFDRICEDFKDILMCYMEEEHVENANLLDFDTENPEHFLGDDEMRIGIEARLLIQQFELPQDQYEILMRMIREYLINLSTEFLERLVNPWAPFACIRCLLMENALSEEYHRQNPDVIEELVNQFPRALPEGFDRQDILELLQRQWDDLLQINLEIFPEPRTDYFWFVVRDTDLGDGIFSFRELGELTLSILSIPHSNAQPERKWSEEKYLKNKYRNKLSVLSVKSILQIKEMLELFGCSKQVHKFRPIDEMIERVRRRLFNIQVNIELDSDTDSDIEGNSDDEGDNNIEDDNDIEDDHE